VVIADDLVAVRRGVLPVEFIEEGVTFCILADRPVRGDSLIDAVEFVGTRSWSATVALVKPRLWMGLDILLADVPKNFGPTE
jgi:hypothetical protein